MLNIRQVSFVCEPSKQATELRRQCTKICVGKMKMFYGDDEVELSLPDSSLKLLPEDCSAFCYY